MKNMINNIFISFSGDDETYAKKLESVCLKYYKFDNIFYAPSSIVAGQKWLLQLKNEIHLSDLVIVLWSEKSISSYGQITEIGASWVLDKEILVVIKGVDKNDVPFILNDYQYILWGNFISDFRSFIKKKPNKFIEGTC